MPGDLRLYAAVMPPDTVLKNAESQHYWTVAVDTSPWFILSDGEPRGPFSAKQLSSDFEYGLLGKDALVWKNGLPGWVPVANASALIALVAMLSELADHKQSNPTEPLADGDRTKNEKKSPAEESIEKLSADKDASEDSGIEDILIEQDEGKMIQAFDKMQGIYSTKKHDEAAAYALDVAHQIIPCSASICLLLAPGSHRYYIAAATGIDSLPAGKSFSPDKGVLGHVMKTRKSIHLADTKSDNRFEPKTDQIGETQIRNMLCAPIQHQGHIFGTLRLINSKEGFLEEDMHVLAYIARGLADFIEVSLPERDGFREEDFASS